MGLHRPLLALLFFLTGCSSTPVTDESSTSYVLPVGSILQLHQSIPIEPHRARAFIQYGRITHEKLINRYYPYCEFEISTLSDAIQTVQPDRFEVYKVIDDEHHVNRYFMTARRDYSFNDGPTILGFASEYFLRSEQQPQVRKLICLHWDEPAYGEYLSLTEIRKALGNLFSIHPATVK